MEQQNYYTRKEMRKMYDLSCGKIGLGLLPDQTENNARFESFLSEISEGKTPVEQLSEDLKSDAAYWDGWQANIAMCVYDEYIDTFPNTNPAVKGALLEIFNKGADRFLKLLTSKKGEENG